VVMEKVSHSPMELEMENADVYGFDFDFDFDLKSTHSPSSIVLCIYGTQ